MSRADTDQKPAISPLHDPRWRGIAYQALLCIGIVALVYSAIDNAAQNLQKARIASGFDFWNHTAGFDISQTLIDYSTASTYGRAFWVGLLNTLLIAGLGIVFATILGFIIGIARLSRNVLVSKLGGAYVEIIRNLPLLLQLLFWYNAVLKALPELADSLILPGGTFLNNRGLFMPRPIAGEGLWLVPMMFVVGSASAVAFRRWAKRRQEKIGLQAPVATVATLLIIGLPLATFVLSGMPVDFAYPEKGRFNIRGGLEILPEFMALLFGLSIYTAAFIAEAVRAGILAVSYGQTEAAYSLGLRPAQTLRRVVIPQAMRVIVPPLTNQYLNLTKNSTLAVAIGYPDLVQVFAGTVLNQTGQAVEVIAITMAVYLTISLITSLLMNIYNARVALVER
ncbi:MAG: amino acid ABC transporter permease [Pseudorhodoplanes sp.]|jgi:general L-amino acid transport system permease protein|nr:amino acid ABC transporter permease [Pseudorhodoplanes sp.]